MCGSGKCLAAAQVCDGKYDCPDRKDERCGDKGNDVQIRLRDGRTPNEGRIEIKGFGQPWGGICDDGFDIPEANVVCRGAGFPLGATEARLQSDFGQGNGVINVDELDCIGDESDILECKSNPWTEHDCSVKEMAGVVCKSEDVPCSSEEWRLENIVSARMLFYNQAHFQVWLWRVHNFGLPVRHYRGLFRRQ